MSADSVLDKDWVRNWVKGHIQDRFYDDDDDDVDSSDEFEFEDVMWNKLKEDMNKAHELNNIKKDSGMLNQEKEDRKKQLEAFGLEVLKEDSEDSDMCYEDEEYVEDWIDTNYEWIKKLHMNRLQAMK